MGWRRRARSETGRSGWWTWLIVAFMVLAAIGTWWKRHHKAETSSGCPTTEAISDVLDGDTVRFACGGALASGRLAGVDAPEKAQAYGPEARAFLEALIDEGPVEVETVGGDRYGRAMLNARMVSAGFAWHYKRYSDDEALAEAEGAARDARLGLWADPEPTPPWAWRKAKKHAD
jgi:endonuclease YncB( thermonuclease family)